MTNYNSPRRVDDNACSSPPDYLGITEDSINNEDDDLETVVSKGLPMVVLDHDDNLMLDTDAAEEKQSTCSNTISSHSTRRTQSSTTSVSQRSSRVVPITRNRTSSRQQRSQATTTSQKSVTSQRSQMTRQSSQGSQVSGQSSSQHSRVTSSSQRPYASRQPSQRSQQTRQSSQRSFATRHSSQHSQVSRQSSQPSPVSRQSSQHSRVTRQSSVTAQTQPLDSDNKYTANQNELHEKQIQERKNKPYRYFCFLGAAAVAALLVVFKSPLLEIIRGSDSSRSNNDADDDPSRPTAFPSVSTPPTGAPLLRSQQPVQTIATMPTQPPLPTTAPTAAHIPCGCPTCTPEILNTPLDIFSDETCHSRMDTWMQETGETEHQACAAVAALHPNACGQCHVDKCDDRGAQHCHCQECTDQIWNRPVIVNRNATTTTITCGQAIVEEMIWSSDESSISGSSLADAEYEACQIISRRFPDTCGQGCNPDTCPSNNPAHCGCASCTENVWNTVLPDGSTCGDRISYLISDVGGGLNDTWACIQVGNFEFPAECALCNPMICHSIQYANAPEPTFCGCPECTPSILDREANGETCINRIAWLQTPVGESHSELEACRITAGRDYPAECTLMCDPDACRGPPKCGCESCTDQVLQRTVDGMFTCADHIYYLESIGGGSLSEADACLTVGANKYPEQCGECDPSRCEGA